MGSTLYHGRFRCTGIGGGVISAIRVIFVYEGDQVIFFNVWIPIYPGTWIRLNPWHLLSISPLTEIADWLNACAGAILSFVTEVMRMPGISNTSDAKDTATTLHHGIKLSLGMKMK